MNDGGGLQIDEAVGFQRREWGVERRSGYVTIIPRWQTMVSGSPAAATSER